MKVFGNVKASIVDPAEVNTGINKVAAGRNSRFGTIIEKINLILQTSEEVEDLLSKTIFELQKPKEYYGRLRESILVGLDSVGVEVKSDIESEIADFIPKHVQRDEGQGK
jgi:hypothetical protein